MSKAYSVVSKFYDRMIEYPYESVLSLVKKHKKSGKTLDLFCGTGRFTYELAKQGYDASGSDISGDMLQKAMEESRRQGYKIVFKQENALKFSYTQVLDLVTACCDGLNYIEKENLETLFKRVFDALSSDGYFIFDVSSYYKITEILGNNFYFEDYDDLTLFWNNTLRKKSNSVKLDLTFFVRDREGKYSREDETQIQYAHTEKDLIELSERVGFSVIEILDENFQKPKEKSERLYFVLRKD